MKRTKTIKADPFILGVINDYYELDGRSADITVFVGLPFRRKEKITTIVDRRFKERITSLI